ncbi:hypothetical protein U27_05016 [Candidatus Vecturithrix granuli]|uniref:Uncharacterized protein n=1 Tax=Vecturithrix granuli TaxID=1499967 RepID=A0A081C0D8_VECG1|nr:hypothetical protein U27_05016 [Candidatus Vecturithrix granuli]
MCLDYAFIEKLYESFGAQTKHRIDQVVSKIVQTKKQNGHVVVVTGSGPNIHEGVTTLIAELIKKDLIDGVITSSAVIAHEMAGSLDKVKRVKGKELPGIQPEFLPRGSIFEVTLMDNTVLHELQEEMIIDTELIERVLQAEGTVIIKAAGNMAYPIGLRTERIAAEIEALAQLAGKPFEYIAGLGADQRTMIGAGARKQVPVLVSVPQLIGGGRVGLAIGDSIPLKQRSRLIAQMLAQAEVIIESGVALTQEIHDGPFETYTGHGIWSAWEGIETFSLQEKTLARIDLDPNLEEVWRLEKSGGSVQKSIHEGMPKTKTFKVPFRMEMSGFARLESSIPIVGDLGVVWPIIAAHVSQQLGIELDFCSYPQESEQGKQMREWIVQNVKMLNKKRMLECMQGNVLFRE